MVSPERSAPRKRSLEVCAPPHPQQNGNSSQIAAAAWFGFAKPNNRRYVAGDFHGKFKLSFTIIFTSASFRNPHHVCRLCLNLI